MAWVRREDFSHEQLMRINGMIATIIWFWDMLWIPSVESTSDLPTWVRDKTLCYVKSSWLVYYYVETDSVWKKIKAV